MVVSTVLEKLYKYSYNWLINTLNLQVKVRGYLGIEGFLRHIESSYIQATCVQPCNLGIKLHSRNTDPKP